MAKRRRSKATTAAKTKANDKVKAAKPSNTEETSSKNANISGLIQESLEASPSGTKKPKLDSSQPLGAKSKKYIPPFTASQRVIRLRRDRVVNAENVEGKLNSQESNVSTGEKGSSQEKSQQGEDGEDNAVMILTTNEDKGNTPCNESVDTKEDVEMEVENMEGEDSNTGQKEDIVSENMSGCLPSQKEISIDNSSNNLEHAKDTAIPPEFDIKGVVEVVKLVPKLVDHHLAQQSFDLIEGSNRTWEQKGRNLVKNVIGGSGESLKDSVTSSKLDINQAIVDAQLRNVLNLQTLADTCVEEEYIDVVTVESTKNESFLKQNTTKRETRSMRKGLSRKRKDDENKRDNSQDLVKEKCPDTNSNATLVKHLDALGVINGYSQEAAPRRRNASQGAANDRSKCSSPEPKLQGNVGFHELQPSQEIIKNKLTEMLLIVAETDGLPLSQTKSEISARPLIKNTERPRTENTDKLLDDPAKEGILVAHTVMMFGDDQNKCMGESDLNNLVDSDGNSQNATTTENIPLKPFEPMQVDNKCDSNVEDSNKQLTAQVSKTNDRVEAAISKRVELAMVKESIPLKPFEAMPAVDGCVPRVEDPNNQRSAQISKTSNRDKNAFSIDKIMGLATSNDKQGVDKNNNDQEVPEEIVTSPTSREERNTSTVNLKKKNWSSEASSVHPTTDISCHKSKRGNATKKMTDSTASCISSTVDELSMTKEFEVLEELLPPDDLGLFDDVIMNQPKSTSVENELPEGDSTIEFLINELTSLHCMVANYERAVEDMKRQYKFNGRF